MIRSDVSGRRRPAFAGPASFGVLAALLAGCNVGPKYSPPAAPSAPAFKEAAPAAYKSALDGSWRPANPRDAAIKGKWWQMFKEPELDALEEQLNISNQTIAQFYQNFMAARAQVREARAAYLPTVTAVPSYSRSRNSVAGIASGATANGNVSGVSVIAPARTNTTASFYSLPFDVSWQPDLWGRIRNTVKEFRYAAQVSAADLENQRLSEEASLAVFYFELRGQDSLRALYWASVEAYKESLNLTRALVKTGIDSPQSTAQAEVVLRDAEATATGFETNRDIFEHAIATLIGKPASSFSMPVKGLSTPVPPIPVGVPSELLERRPDIAAAERTMAEANALIGVEKAAYYPSLNLTGSAGVQSSTISTLFTLPAVFWSLGASATEILFDGGLRHATVRQFTAQYNADVAAYKQTVLTAFQQVEDFISTLRVTSTQIEQQRAAVDAAQTNLNLAVARYRTGLDPYLNVIAAQTALLTDQQTLATLRVSEMTAAVQLIQALGGGWDVMQLPGS
jgi:NodT family efflux transporter outer membrane factor (OMF) lipoprotein